MTRKLKILIADDEEILRDLFEMILESEFNCETIKVSSSDLAIEALKVADDFSLIISDYKMLGGNGGAIYSFNKDHQKIPFFLFSGGELQDYAEFSDLKNTNELNHFFNKPFDTEKFLAAVRKITYAIEEHREYIRVDISHYVNYSQSPAEIYLKLSDNKYTKIIHANEETISQKALFDHYLQKGIYDIYLERSHFNQLLHDIFKYFNQMIVSEAKARVAFQIAGFNFLVCAEGLVGIGISNAQINKINGTIENTINTLLNDLKSQNYIKKLCDNDGYIIGHSLLIMYVAAKICFGTNLNFNSTMTRICAAAFFHDFSLLESDRTCNEMHPCEISDAKTSERILHHPQTTADYLPEDNTLNAEVKKIIHEHHESPDGDGYPRKLHAAQIAPLSCLFILAEHITFCLLRNNFSKERLQDFLSNSEKKFNQGNFSHFYFSAMQTFKK